MRQNESSFVDAFGQLLNLYIKKIELVPTFTDKSSLNIVGSLFFVRRDVLDSGNKFLATRIVSWCRHPLVLELSSAESRHSTTSLKSLKSFRVEQNTLLSVDPLFCLFSVCFFSSDGWGEANKLLSWEPHIKVVELGEQWHLCTWPCFSASFCFVLKPRRLMNALKIAGPAKAARLWGICVLLNTRTGFLLFWWSRWCDHQNSD